MGYRIINEEINCVDCTYANVYGTGCKHGLLFPVMVKMGILEGKLKSCPNFKMKTEQQIKEQLELLEKLK